MLGANDIYAQHMLINFYSDVLLSFLSVFEDYSQ